MGGLHLHDKRIVAVYHRSIQDCFAGKAAPKQNIHCYLHYAVAPRRIDKSGIQLAREYLLHPVTFAGNGIRTHETHLLRPMPAHGGCISAGGHAVVLGIYHIYLRKTAEQRIHSLLRPQAQPCPVLLRQQADVRIGGYDTHKPLVAVYGGGRACQPGYLHHRTLAAEHIGYVPAHRLAYLVVVRTHVGGIFIGKNPAVYHDNGNTPVVGIFYHRGYRFGFVRGDN